MGEVEALAIYVAVALCGGGVALMLRLPPLVGFLAAGFALSAVGAPSLPALPVISSLGVTLLLFGLGLKVEIHQFLRPRCGSSRWLTLAAAWSSAPGCSLC